MFALFTSKYVSKRQVVSQYEEYGFAKHTHIEVKGRSEQT